MLHNKVKACGNHLGENAVERVQQSDRPVSGGLGGVGSIRLEQGRDHAKVKIRGHGAGACDSSEEAR
jgi:hypothetical protein